MKTSASPAADTPNLAPQLAANDAPDTLCFGKAAGRPRAADKEARQQALLHTAASLFLEKGYGKVSLEMIAREAHVAVRTIYVKFGGKAGLLSAVITNGRARFFEGMQDMQTDVRPLQEILGDFSLRFVELVTLPTFASLCRMVVAEAKTTPELAESFYHAGPQQTREQLALFFARPEIRAQLRDDVPLEALPVHLLNCIMGDQLLPMLFAKDVPPSTAENCARVELGLNLFFASVLRK
ncbi:MAG: TetR/AcrR family transcriptional regulator [Sphingomonadaceae bacterium]